TSGAFAGGQAGLFEVDYSSNLYQLNAATGKASLIGSTGLAANNGNYDTSLAMNGSILYYTAGKAGAKDELYQISTTTGITTDLGSTGVTGIAGSAFVNGSLELFQYGQAANYIYTAAAGSISFAKGAQLNAQILDGGAFQSAPSSNALTAPSGVPEPTTFMLLGGGLAL